MKKPRQHIEHDMQVAFFKACEIYPTLKWMHAVPNSMPGDVAAQMWMNREGRKAGVLDMFLPRVAPFRQYKICNCAYYHGLYLEFKKPEMIVNGKKQPAGELSNEQARFILYADLHGYAVAISRSVQSAIDVTLRYLAGNHNNEPALEECRKKLRMGE